MSIATELERIINAKKKITLALERKGFNVSLDDTLDNFADTIDPITKGEELEYLEKDQNYLTFKWVQDGKFYWKTSNTSFTRDIQYKKNGTGEWITITSSSVGYVCDCETGDEIWVKGNNTTYGESSYYCSFYNIGLAYISGNVNSLINFSNTLNNYCFCLLFSSCKNIDIDNKQKLLLPATTLAGYCYYRMFGDCTNLTTAPELPATTLANYCYHSMFWGCSSLTTAPELPATTLNYYCYNSMFYDCPSLTTAPKLPATTLADYCYYNMFNGCKSLRTAPELPATTLKAYCYYGMFYNCVDLTTAPELPATTLANYCYNIMFNGCSSLTTAPELPATTLKARCYYRMFYNCVDLTTAPELPATTLVDNCYSGMFSGCKNLTYIKAMFTSTPSTSYTNNWVSNVAASGTFVKNSAATWTTSGVNGVPDSWTVQTASA